MTKLFNRIVGQIYPGEVQRGPRRPSPCSGVKVQSSQQDLRSPELSADVQPRSVEPSSHPQLPEALATRFRVSAPDLRTPLGGWGIVPQNTPQQEHEDAGAPLSLGEAAYVLANTTEQFS